MTSGTPTQVELTGYVDIQHVKLLRSIISIITPVCLLLDVDMDDARSARCAVCGSMFALWGVRVYVNLVTGAEMETEHLFESLPGYAKLACNQSLGERTKILPLLSLIPPDTVQPIFKIPDSP